jgi:hypothetical protein
MRYLSANDLACSLLERFLKLRVSLSPKHDLVTAQSETRECDVGDGPFAAQQLRNSSLPMGLLASLPPLQVPAQMPSAKLALTLNDEDFSVDVKRDYLDLGSREKA